MKRIAAAVAGFSAMALSGAAHAGIYTDDLSKCLVKATVEGDRLDLVVWIFDAITQHPAVSALSNVTPAQREATDRKIAQLLTRLLTQDCRGQTVDAIKYEGAGALQESFAVLGRVAVSGLMSEPKVSTSIAGMAKYMDEDKFKAMMTDAGQPPPPAKK